MSCHVLEPGYNRKLGHLVTFVSLKIVSDTLLMKHRMYDKGSGPKKKKKKKKGDATAAYEGVESSCLVGKCGPGYTLLQGFGSVSSAGCVSLDLVPLEGYTFKKIMSEIQTGSESSVTVPSLYWHNIDSYWGT